MIISVGIDCYRKFSENDWEVERITNFRTERVKDVKVINLLQLVENQINQINTKQDVIDRISLMYLRERSKVDVSQREPFNDYSIRLLFTKEMVDNLSDDGLRQFAQYLAYDVYNKFKAGRE